MPRKSKSEDRNTAIDYLNRDIVNIKNELQTLNKLVRDGNGQPSLMTQVATLHSELNHVEAELKESLHELKQAVNSHHQFSIDKNKTSWQFKSAVWVALITSVTSVIIHLTR